MEYEDLKMDKSTSEELVGTPMPQEDGSQLEFIVCKNDKRLSSMRNLIDLKNIVAK